LAQHITKSIKRQRRGGESLRLPALQRKSALEEHDDSKRMTCFFIALPSTAIFCAVKEIDVLQFLRGKGRQSITTAATLRLESLLPGKQLLHVLFADTPASSAE
jgi:hypothetical protein